MFLIWQNRTKIIVVLHSRKFFKFSFQKKVSTWRKLGSIHSTKIILSRIFNSVALWINFELTLSSVRRILQNIFSENYKITFENCWRILVTALTYGQLSVFSSVQEPFSEQWCVAKRNCNGSAPLIRPISQGKSTLWPAMVCGHE